MSDGVSSNSGRVFVAKDLNRKVGQEAGIAKATFWGRKITYKPDGGKPIELNRSSVLKFIERNNEYGSKVGYFSSEEKIMSTLARIVILGTSTEQQASVRNVFKRTFEDQVNSFALSTRSSVASSLTGTPTSSSGTSKKNTPPPTPEEVDLKRGPRTTSPISAPLTAPAGNRPLRNADSTKQAKEPSHSPGLESLELAEAIRRSTLTQNSSSSSLDSIPEAADDSEQQKSLTNLYREALAEVVFRDKPYGLSFQTISPTVVGPRGEKLTPEELKGCILRAFDKSIKEYGQGQIDIGTQEFIQTKQSRLIAQMRELIEGELNRFRDTGSLTQTPAPPATETPAPTLAQTKPVQTSKAKKERISTELSDLQQGLKTVYEKSRLKNIHPQPHPSSIKNVDVLDLILTLKFGKEQLTHRDYLTNDVSQGLMKANLGEEVKKYNKDGTRYLESIFGDAEVNPKLTTLNALIESLVEGKRRRV